MRLLALADIHDHFGVVDEILRKANPVDVLILAGDLTTNGTPAQVERAIQSWRPRVPHLFAVAGNMDSPAIDETLERLGVSLNGHGHRVGDVAFCGCSAAPVSIGTPYELPESELQRRIELGFHQADSAARLVFVPHAPPRGAVDRTGSGISAGSEAVRRFVDRAQPGLVLCGHIHEARGQARLGQSLVVNCGPACRGHYVIADLTDDWEIRMQ
jgi:hypothetical protein